MIRLGVNIDHVATLRQARGEESPSVLKAAEVAEAAGADGITVHLREDRRHIQDADVYALRKSVKTMLNLEMALSDDVVSVALDVVPEQVTLVPEKRQELTTEGGLDVIENAARIADVLPLFKEKGIIVSLFIDPVEKQVRKAAEIGVEAIELHTGEYAHAWKKKAHEGELRRLIDAAECAAGLGLQVNAGHGLDFENVGPVCNLPQAAEFNIGHSIISRAVFTGLDSAVREMKTLIKENYS